MHGRVNIEMKFLRFELIFSKLVGKCCDLFHVFKRNRRGNRMVGGEHITAALLHCRDDSFHLGRHAVNVVPNLRVDAAVEGELVAIKIFEFEGIHSCLDL